MRTVAQESSHLKRGNVGHHINQTLPRNHRSQRIPTAIYDMLITLPIESGYINQHVNNKNK